MWCRVPACNFRAFQRGYCTMHYQRVRRYGGPGPAEMIGKWAPLEARFNNYVQSGPGCWVWTGPVHRRGSGTIGFKGRKEYAHRVAFYLAFGYMPLSGQVRHSCGNKLCVRADHLYSTQA